LQPVKAVTSAASVDQVDAAHASADDAGAVASLVARSKVGDAAANQNARSQSLCGGCSLSSTRSTPDEYRTYELLPPFRSALPSRSKPSTSSLASIRRRAG
jgi:hypothetical protein